MDTQSYKTVSANRATVNKQWVLIDAENEVLGRLASKAAKMIRGKNKTEFTPHVDCGDNVIVINAEKVKLTGNKMTEKEYVRHTGYPEVSVLLLQRNCLFVNLKLLLKWQLEVCYQKLNWAMLSQKTCLFMQVMNIRMQRNNPKKLN